ncbi:myosin heavy chain, clone 203-like [Chironomus tepperi]|uniref:myosin heavy chain, clone 203-like n=1 Tax=Chironomus tepperi TaxID=113505 RepID=UPI00391EF4FE
MIFPFLIIVFLTFLKAGCSLNLECIYGTLSYNVGGNLYSCNLQNSLNINSPKNAVVHSATGAHASGKNDSDVEGFYVESDKKIEYFPKNLENIFFNLKVIWIQNNYVKEIHQSDLKPFPKLVYLKFGSNDIQVLEEGLFDYNHDLNGIYLQSNNIFHIDENIFDNLVTKLTYLVLSSNQCINIGTHGDATKIQEIVNEIKQKCQDENYIKLNKNLKSLESKLDSLSVERISVFLKNVESLESEFSKSKFSNLTSFRRRLEELRELANETQIKHTVIVDGPKSCISCCNNEKFVTILKNIGLDINSATQIQTNMSLTQNQKQLQFDEKLQNLEEIIKVSASMFNKTLENANDLKNLKEVVDTVVSKMDKIEKKLDRILALIKTED